MKKTLIRNVACYFWGALDMFYIIRYLWIDIVQRRIPLISDVIDFSHMSAEYGGEFYITTMFLLSLVLNVSIVFSAVLLLLRWKKVHVLVYAQIPFRLLLVIPSLSIAPWLLKNFDIHSLFALVFVLIVSELLKMGSFVLATKPCSTKS